MMKNEILLFGVLAWLALTIPACCARRVENDSDLKDTVAALVEQLAKLSDQMTKQSNQLDQLSDQQTKQSTQLKEMTTRQEDTVSRLDIMEEQATQDNAEKMDIERKVNAPTGGPTFTRWGFKSCNGTKSELVYSGATAGTSDANAGGSANFLCLPRNPSYKNYDHSGHEGDDIVITEYRLNSNNNFPFEHEDFLLNHNDVPCAVCQVMNASSVMMIPARVECYADWKLEYRGYLMSGHIYNGNRREYICVDSKPEVDYDGGGSAAHIAGIYTVEGYCDSESLPCPPYVHLAELSCVVCSK